MSESLTTTPTIPAALSEPVAYRLQVPVNDFGENVSLVEVRPLRGRDLMETAQHTNHELRIYALMARAVLAKEGISPGQPVGESFISSLQAEDMGALFEIVENFLPSGLRAIGLASRLGLDMNSILAPAKSST